MDFEEYLRRIGAERPAHADLASLRELQRRHLESVPFENLGRYLGEEIDLTEAGVLEKIVRQRRGGLCYELNGAFALLLEDVGFDVHLLAGRVTRGAGEWGPPFDHLALRVDLDEPWLVDVGFGRFSLRPLRLGTAEPQPDPLGSFSVRPAPAGDLDLLLDGNVVYRLEPAPRELADFTATARFHANSPDSPFAHGPTCSLWRPGGRVTIAGHRLIETTDGDRAESELEDDQAILEAYREHFGYRLQRVPRA
ncbi:arylamine N-acetyltransferase [Amycolatopsis rhabdoformis]|uniref:Arylamine N-acetyltransferase n=1 Tax=Amycolatopsis rhabdoformis TaxID=1448059 RepID=A0ABZ1IIA4_9PSEU|nr:arylamine N-acetyltransferase [Amycolatopsis rhabdoformis]WSE34122.1 arylamine N-acetyltransferase [Amycolatopsis rhabdoformis]